MPTFTQIQLEAIAGALGDTSGGLTEGEISALFEMASIPDADAGLDTRQRLFAAFADVQTTRNDRTHILAFICTAMQPERFAREPERFEAMRLNVNRALALAGLIVSEEGKLEAMRATSKLSEAAKRARGALDFTDLVGRTVDLLTRRATAAWTCNSRCPAGRPTGPRAGSTGWATAGGW